MIRLIVRKEVLENVLSLRFALSLLLVVAAFAVGGFAFVSKYEQQVQDYSVDSNGSLTGLRKGAGQLFRLAFYTQEVYRTPTPLTLCVEGFEKSIPNYYRFTAFSRDCPVIKGRANALLFGFCDVDWVFIVSMFLSFGALVFAHDSLSGEKEAGTLALLLAGSVPRYEVLLAKYIAIMLTLGIPMLVGILVNLLIVTRSSAVAIHAGEWLKVLAIVLMSFLYLSVFVLLGMFVSSWAKRSVISMVILLFLWVGLVIVVPSSGRTIAQAFRTVPTQAELQREINDAMGRLWNDCVAGKYGEKAGTATPDVNECDPPGRARFRNDATEQRNRMIDEHVNRMIAQVAVGRQFTRLSPAEIFRQACETVAGTGIQHFSQLCRQTTRYQNDFREYIRSRDSEDPASLHLLSDDGYAAGAWKTISHKSVDFDTVPRFQEQDLALGQSLKLATWDIGLLVLFNLAFFTAAFVSFSHYDAR
jgi:ABC-type transport system involved in multi-copper enzyme maturation permease subunit